MTTRKRTRRGTKDTNKPPNTASTTTDTHPSATSSSTVTTGGKTPGTTPAEIPKPKKQPPSPSLPPPPPPPPPPTPAHGLASVSPPGSKTPLSKFIYVLVLGATVLLAWYIYGMITLLAELKEEVGWWGVIIGGEGGGFPLGDRGNWQEWAWHPWRVSRTGEMEGRGGLEERLNALADELGIPSREVASAIKPVVPPASLTSLALGTRETERSEVVRVLLEDVKGRIAEGEREDEWAEELEKE